VIEQAKGIIMAQNGCWPEEAFDLLRRASQRANVKVRELAVQIVEHVACGDSRGNVTPIVLGARRRYQRSETRARPPTG
jgi:dihydrodipicolinate synthase/N-acetylneuraminate lyase